MTMRSKLARSANHALSASGETTSDDSMLLALDCGVSVNGSRQTALPLMRPLENSRRVRTSSSKMDGADGPLGCVCA